MDWCQLKHFYLTAYQKFSKPSVKITAGSEKNCEKLYKNTQIVSDARNDINLILLYKSTFSQSALD